MPVAKTNSRSHFVPDARQREAIEYIHGPVLVVAGAGTGKTSVLVQRIAHLVKAGHARPDEILALTYTKNAANEMRERVRGLIGEGVRAATFHDCCLDLLNELAGISAFSMILTFGSTCAVASVNFICNILFAPPMSANF